MMAVSQAMVPVCAASYGARRVDRIDTAYKYAVKLILLVMIAITAVTLIFAPQICVMFTYSDNTAGLRDGMVEMLRIMVLALPLMGLGFVSSGFFQALGMGMKSLISTLFRNLLQIPICIYLATFGILSYIWVGAATAEIFGSVVMGFWGFLLLKYMLREWKSHGGSPAE
jgi:Na+-driven multidrug efflux pump